MMVREEWITEPFLKHILIITLMIKIRGATNGMTYLEIADSRRKWIRCWEGGL